MIESGDGWYVADSDGLAQGPLTRAALQALRDAGKIGDDHLVWTLRQAEWVPLRRALGIKSAAASDAARPPSAAPTRPAQPSGKAAKPKPEAKSKPKAAAARTPPMPGTAPIARDDWRQPVGKQAPAAVAAALLAAGKDQDLAVRRERATQGLRRLLARSVDLALLGGIGWAALSLIGIKLGAWLLMAPQAEFAQSSIIAVIVLVLAALPLEAALVGISGYTPGRLLLGIRVVNAHGGAPGISIGFNRAARVALYGQALLVFPFMLVTYGIAFASLVGKGRTHWDQALSLSIRSTPLSPNQWWAGLAAAGVAWALLMGGFWMRIALQILTA